MFAARGRILRLTIFCAFLVLWARVAHLQLGLGPWRRAVRAEWQIHTRPIPALRGSIQTTDGTVLAEDRCRADLAVHYRYLERPTDEQWLTQQARGRLTRRQRRDPAQVQRARDAMRKQIEDTWQALADASGTPPAELERRAALVQQRIERIVQSVNRRRLERWHAQTASSDGRDGGRQPASRGSGVVTRLCAWLAGDSSADAARAPEPVTVVEQEQYYALVQDVAPDVVLEFAAHPERFAGVRLEQRIRRVYPENDRACAIVGYVAAGAADGTPDGDTVGDSGRGVTGIEGFYDEQLAGRAGQVREEVARGDSLPRVLGGRAPQRGRDIELTLDLRVQVLAEQLLDRALHEDGRSLPGTTKPSSGAIVLLDVHSGALLAGAVAPRFDLNVASRPSSDAAIELAGRADSPLFNRLVQMTLPPGSTFKPVAALASLKAGADPSAPYPCRGYLLEPDKFRCLIFRNIGIGHDQVTMSDALVRSCNVYFFQLAERLPADSLAHWAYAFGFGVKSGMDVAFEEPGQLPGPTTDHGSANPSRVPRDSRTARSLSASQRKLMVIGQGTFEATPVQVAVMAAALANGGRRVVPHVRRDAFQPPLAIDGLNPSDGALAVVRAALEQVVGDPRGTAHEHVYLSGIPIAGKTGTAQSGSPLGDHAWFAGYFPADRPRYAVSVVLEHAGSGGHAAGPIARQLVHHMLELGLIDGSPRRRGSATSPAVRAD